MSMISGDMERDSIVSLGVRSVKAVRQKSTRTQPRTLRRLPVVKWKSSTPEPIDNTNTGNVDLGIAIDDTVNDLDKPPSWGRYDPSHVYTIDIVGLGAPASFNFHDAFYPDGSPIRSSFTGSRQFSCGDAAYDAEFASSHSARAIRSMVSCTSGVREVIRVSPPSLNRKSQ